APAREVWEGGTDTRRRDCRAAEWLSGFRAAPRPAGGRERALSPNAFPPPFSFVWGRDFARAARHSAGISVKLYTMHWPMMLRFYGDALREANPSIDERLLVRALAAWFDIADDGGFERLPGLRSPGPEGAPPPR